MRKMRLTVRTTAIEFCSPTTKYFLMDYTWWAYFQIYRRQVDFRITDKENFQSIFQHNRSVLANVRGKLVNFCIVDNLSNFCLKITCVYKACLKQQEEYLEKAAAHKINHHCESFGQNFWYAIKHTRLLYPIQCMVSGFLFWYRDKYVLKFLYR